MGTHRVPSPESRLLVDRAQTVLAQRSMSRALTQRGSILLDTVLFLALLSVLLMALVGQLTFMTKVSAQEDARVQGLMAARIQMEDMRTKWDEDWLLDNVNDTAEDVFTPVGFDRLGEGRFVITKSGDSLYQVEIQVDDQTGKTVCETLTQVWVTS